MSPGAGHEAMVHRRRRSMPAPIEVRMSLSKKPTTTEKKIAGSCASRGRSNGLAAPACQERTRAADLASTHPGTMLIMRLEARTPVIGVRGSSFAKSADLKDGGFPYGC